MVEQRPITPPSLSSAPQIDSSPVTRVPKYFAEHRRDQVQAFAYDQVLHQLHDFKSEPALLKFLQGRGEDRIPLSNIPIINEWSPESFIEGANVLAEFIKDNCFADSPLLIFRHTPNKSFPGHVTDTECRPDFIAAFEDHFDGKDTLWPYIRLTGEHASKGKTRDKQKEQAISYLHYLLLARPDLYVAQGLFTSKTGIMFLVGIGGQGICSLAVEWNNKSLTKLMYAFTYRLYEPGQKFADPSYELGDVIEKKHVTFTIRLARARGQEEIVCRNFRPIYASSPFGTRTHVFSKPDSEIKIGDKGIKVIKDQFCRLGTRFDEQSILQSIHQRGKVPGIVEAVYHERIKIPPLGSEITLRRVKHRLGMEQYGRPFMTIPDMKTMLETLFDTLEAIRFLRVHRNILHRDISKGNIVFMESPEIGTLQAFSSGSACQKAPVYAKYLLGESTEPQQTSTLLIDFNHAEDLKRKRKGKRVDRTGTSVFIARAIELSSPLPFPTFGVTLVLIPTCPASYATEHPDRDKQFGGVTENTRLTEPVQARTQRPWRHELDHDVESVFWLLFYWALCARPKKETQIVLVDAGIWAQLTGKDLSRVFLLHNLHQFRLTKGVVHSDLEEIAGLINALAGILALDRHWLSNDEPRNNTVYFVEAFQRLILQFIVANRHKPFMTLPIHRVARQIEGVSRVISLSGTSGQMASSEGKRKQSDAADEQNNRSKRRRHDEPSEERSPEDDPDRLPATDDTADDINENWKKGMEEVGDDELEEPEP
ncbi:hypothetical protein FRB90_005305, partial [Tulasnella sp. 427]